MERSKTVSKTAAPESSSNCGRYYQLAGAAPAISVSTGKTKLLVASRQKVLLSHIFYSRDRLKMLLGRRTRPESHKNPKLLLRATELKRIQGFYARGSLAQLGPPIWLLFCRRRAVCCISISHRRCVKVNCMKAMGAFASFVFIFYSLEMVYKLVFAFHIERVKAQ